VSAFVLDNSVTMRWCFDSGAHAYADQVVAADGRFVVAMRAHPDAALAAILPRLAAWASSRETGWADWVGDGAAALWAGRITRVMVSLASTQVDSPVSGS